MPKNVKSVKRRIKLSDLASATFSSTSLEFVLHVPQEYDYRYRANDDSSKDAIYSMLVSIYFEHTHRNLRVSITQEEELDLVCMTRDQASLLSREEKLIRQRQLYASDQIEEDCTPDQSTTAYRDDVKSIDIKAFYLLKVIGRGSFGKVLQVQKKDTRKIYAMKILKKSQILKRGQVAHTNCERKVLEASDHPFLMKLRYAFQTDTKLYFVLDYYPGGELFFHLKRKRTFSEKEAKFICAEVGMGLGYLHSLDFVYRDLKPENILLDRHGHVCLTDFGLAKELESLEGGDHKTHTFCGTPEYLAPEVIEGLGHGKAVDWWSLGILLFELTTGNPPFYSDSVHTMYKMILKQPLRIPKSVSPLLKDVIQRLLCRDPLERLGTGPTDFEEIQTHEFFASLNFTALYEKTTKAPYVPNVRHGSLDVGNVANEFKREPAVDTPVRKPKILDNESLFEGFEYGGK